MSTILKPSILVVQCSAQHDKHTLTFAWKALLDIGILRRYTDICSRLTLEIFKEPLRLRSHVQKEASNATKQTITVVIAYTCPLLQHFVEKPRPKQEITHAADSPTWQQWHTISKHKRHTRLGCTHFSSYSISAAFPMGHKSSHFNQFSCMFLSPKNPYRPC